MLVSQLSTFSWFLALPVLSVCFQKTASEQNFTIMFEELTGSIEMGESVEVYYNVSVNESYITVSDYYLLIESADSHIAQASKLVFLNESENGFHNSSFTITGNFLGLTKINFQINKEWTVFKTSMAVAVVRQQRAIDSAFTICITILLCIIYVNFGCALQWEELKNNLKKPVGPAVGLGMQFLVLPLLSYAFGVVLFPSNPAIQLGYFLVGCSPGGGNSNLFAVLLDGNLDLSITMTAVSTIAAFAMMPLWIFTLGRTIFEEGDLIVPYLEITQAAATLLLPLIIGICIRRYFRKVADFFTKILKKVVLVKLILVVALAIASNTYLLELFTWQVIVAGFGIPWLGYILGYLAGLLFKQSETDSLTIAIESGIQNSNIAIVLVRYCLPQPEADLSTVAPISVAIMTPVPLLILFIYKRMQAKIAQKRKTVSVIGENSTKPTDITHNKDQTPSNISTIS